MVGDGAQPGIKRTLAARSEFLDVTHGVGERLLKDIFDLHDGPQRRGNLAAESPTQPIVVAQEELSQRRPIAVDGETQ